MQNIKLSDLASEIEDNVRKALIEDVRSDDITAKLVPPGKLANASIMTREACVISGISWVEEVFR